MDLLSHQAEIVSSPSELRFMAERALCDSSGTIIAVLIFTFLRFVNFCTRQTQWVPLWCVEHKPVVKMTDKAAANTWELLMITNRERASCWMRFEESRRFLKQGKKTLWLRYNNRLDAVNEMTSCSARQKTTDWVSVWNTVLSFHIGSMNKDQTHWSKTSRATVIFLPDFHAWFMIPSVVRTCVASTWSDLVI